MDQPDHLDERTYGLIALTAVLAAVMFGLPLLLDIPLLDPTEGLHASMAQEMVERDRWLMPQLFGKPFLDKPIVHFWAMAASLRLFGMHEAAVRLPGLMFGVLAAAATGAMAGRMLGRVTGLIAGALYATMLLPTALVQCPTTDVALIPGVIIALWLFWEGDRAHSRRALVLLTLGTGAALAFCMLTKGLVGVAVVGAAYGGYLLIERKLTLTACLRGAAALAVAAAVSSAWFLAVEARAPGYLHYYFIERTLLGYATESQHHSGKPWWYYLPILLLGGMPWIAYLPGTLLRPRRHRVATAEAARSRPGMFRHLRWPSAPQSATTLPWCWLLIGTLLFSLAGSKLVTYIWPVLPPIAILAAIAWGRLLEGTLNDSARRHLLSTLRLSCLSGPLALPAALVAAHYALGLEFSPWTWALAVLLAGGSVLPWLFARRGKFQEALAAATLSVAAQFALLMIVVVPPAIGQFSARALAEHFNRRGELPPRVLLAEERVGSIVFYLDPTLREGLNDKRFEHVFLADLPPIDPRSLVVLPERELERAEGHVRLAGRPYRRVGNYRLYDAATFAAAAGQTIDRLAAKSNAKAIE